jgi:hypothetical protein
MITKLINLIFQKGMFFIVLIIFIVFNIFSKFEGINKTIGWGWNLINDLIFVSPFVYIFLFYLFFIVYVGLTITKKETNKFVSILHFFLIGFSALMLEKNNFEILLLLNLMSGSVFLLNIYWSIMKPKRNN